MPLDETEKRPDSPIALPTDQKKLLHRSLELIEECRDSAGMRAAYCRQLYGLSETGRQDGTRSIINMMFNHLDRLQSHLFSPTILRFTMDFENEYPDTVLKRAKKAAKILTRDWERNNTDIFFGMGTFEALRYGATFLKQWVQEEGPDRTPVYYKSLVMPWQFGVQRESLNELSRQPAMCETIMLSMPEVWRRIWHLPNAEALFQKIKSNARKNAGDESNSMFHQVLSTATISTSNTSLSKPVPGGIVQLNNDPNYSIIGPQEATDLVKMHELWVWDGTDYCTIQVIEPDILVAPMFQRTNLLI